MIIASQNLNNYDVNLPENVVFRINLAWINDLKDLLDILSRHKENKIFIDLPKNRTKPPNNKYTMDEIKPILEKFQNIKYFAISNVDTKDDLAYYLDYIPNTISIVPKIESPKGVNNINEIVNSLRNEKIIMLDHDDLYSSMIKSNDDPKNFSTYIETLVNFCLKNDVILLRTVGVIFADTEKRTSEYVK